MYAAGILPISRVDGRVVFLLGREVDGTWSDFGGRCERVDRGCTINTATREFYEESLGTVASAAGLRKRIVRGNCVVLRGQTQNGHPYTMYVVEVPYSTALRAAFHKAVEFSRHAGGRIEKTDVAWVTLDELTGPGGLNLRPAFRGMVEAHAGALRRIATEPWVSLAPRR